MASLEYCKTSNKSKLPFTFTTFISCQEYQINPAKNKKNGVLYMYVSSFMRSLQVFNCFWAIWNGFLSTVYVLFILFDHNKNKAIVGTFLSKRDI